MVDQLLQGPGTQLSKVSPNLPEEIECFTNCHFFILAIFFAFGTSQTLGNVVYARHGGFVEGAEMFDGPLYPGKVDWRFRQGKILQHFSTLGRMLRH